jgi:phage FluMu protein Com
MSIVCSGCEKHLKVRDAAAGKKVRCPACKAVIAVPDPEDDLVETDDDLEERESSSCFNEAEDFSPRVKRRDDEDDNHHMRRFALQPHRGAATLVGGLLSILLGFACPFFAWILGCLTIVQANTDLGQMAAGRMDPSGSGLTKSGRICAVIGVVLGIIVAIGMGVQASKR